MKLTRSPVLKRVVSLTLILSVGLLSTGCATMAHKSSSGQWQAVSSCDAEAGELCPWVAGDVGLLLLGVIPGVVALAVDASNGAMHHGVK